MFSLYKLIAKTKLKSPVLAFPLIMPIIFILLYSTGVSTGLEQAGVDATVATFFVTIVSVNTMNSGLMGFGINFIEIKKSVLLRRIGATELSKTQVIFAILLFGLTLWIISFVWIFLWIILFSAMGVFSSAAGIYWDGNIADGMTEIAHKSSLFGWISNVSWGKLTIATLLMIYASYSLGMLFTSISKNDQMYMGISMLYFFFAGFFGGLMFPGNIPRWMEIIGYLIPHSYLNSIYGWAAGETLNTVEAVTGVLVPIAFGSLLLWASIKTLKFD